MVEPTIAEPSEDAPSVVIMKNILNDHGDTKFAGHPFEKGDLIRRFIVDGTECVCSSLPFISLNGMNETVNALNLLGDKER